VEIRELWQGCAREGEVICLPFLCFDFTSFVFCFELYIGGARIQREDFSPKPYDFIGSHSPLPIQQYDVGVDGP
jgi:hypothetical protein